jgi:general secretion pathway protein C
MPLDAWIRRYFGVIVALLLALAAYFQAGGLSQLVATMLLGEDDPSAQLPTVRVATAAPAPTVQRRSRSADPILSRNPFDSVTGPLDGRQVPTEVVVEKADLSSPLTAPDCDGITAVIITESRDPTWSIAAIKGGGEDKPTMKRVGDKVGDREVAFIGYNPAQQSPAVWLINQSQLCQALLFKRAAAAKPAAATPAAAAAPAAEAGEPAGEAPRGGAAKIPPEMASKIQKNTETEYTLERSLVDEIMENQGTLMKSARIVPETKNGETLGIRLFGIRPDTLLGTLGLQNGDRLEEINGFKMGNPEQALEAYARLRTAASLTIKINRRGKAMNLDYAFK